MKRFFSLIISVIIAAAVILPVSAAAPSAYIKIYKYNSVSGNWVETSETESGDLLMVELGFAGERIPSVKSMRFKLTYSGSKATYVESSDVYGEGVASPMLSSKYNSASPDESYILTYWVWSSQSGDSSVLSDFTGKVASFIFTCNATNGACNFKLEISEMYDKNYNAITLSGNSVSKGVSITEWNLSSEQLAILQKMENISYPDSADDIKAVDEMYKSLTGAEQLKIKDRYPELFAAYSNAWTTYYKLAKEASEQEIKTEVTKFTTDYDSILALSSDDVSNDNYESVLDMYTSYSNLSSQAKTHVDKAVTEKILALYDKAKSIKNKIEDAELADIIADDFLNNYSLLWNLDDATVIDTYESLEALIAEAYASYNSDLDLDNMSPEKRAEIESQGSLLEHYLELIKKTVADNEEESAILDEILAFTNRWSSVFKLNALTVKITDKRAIELMLADYEKLSDKAKERLSSQKRNGEQLLSMISALNTVQGDNTENVLVPGAETITMVKTVEVPVEKPVEVVTEVVKTNSILRTVPKIVLVMVILAGISVLSVFVSFTIYAVRFTRQKKVAAGGEYDEDQ